MNLFARQAKTTFFHMRTPTKDFACHRDFEKNKKCVLVEIFSVSNLIAVLRFNTFFFSYTSYFMHIVFYDSLHFFEKSFAFVLGDFSAHANYVGKFFAQITKRKILQNAFYRLVRRI